MGNLIFEKQGRIGILTMSRPKALNALNRETLAELRAFLSETLPREAVRVLVVTGDGDKAFIAGADIREMQSLNPVEADAFLALGGEVALLFEKLDMVTLAAVNGFALGGGLEIALACDFIYAAETARLGCPEASLGIIPGFGGTQRLARAVGARLAKELICSGRLLTAEEARGAGLVNRVFPKEQLLPEALAVAGKILSNGFEAVLKARRAVDEGLGLPLEAGLALERRLCAGCFSGPEQAEGMAAFLEKRKPNFA